MSDNSPWLLKDIPWALRERHKQLGYSASSVLTRAADEIERLQSELAQAKEQLAAREVAILDLVEVIGFYANPETYFAIGFFPDPPNGEFMDDFDETELGQKPGKRARAIIEKHGDITFNHLRKHEAKVYEHAAQICDAHITCYTDDHCKDALAALSKAIRLAQEND